MFWEGPKYVEFKKNISLPVIIQTAALNGMIRESIFCLEFAF